jgi:hypothetical protein
MGVHLVERFFAVMQHLIRKQWLDCIWDAADLDAAAEFWLRLYEDAARAEGFTATPSHALEICLRGFARQQTEAVRDELARRLRVHHDATGTPRASDFPSPEIEQLDPDTLAVSSCLIFGNQAPPAGLGLSRLAGPPFDGLCVEVRLWVGGVERGSVGKAKVHATLVLVGELRDGRLLLKALWRSGPSGWEDQLNWAAEWPDQEEWRAALERFRETAEAPKKLATKLFVPREADRFGGLVVRMIHVPLDKPRLAGLLKRSLMFLTLIAVLGFALFDFVGREWWLGLVPIALLGLFVLWVAWQFAKNEFQLLFAGYGEFRSRYAQNYEQAVKVVPLARMEAEPRLDNPWARKYTAELESAGFRYAGDCRLEPELQGDCVIRIFFAPDGVSYLNLLFSMSTSAESETSSRMWPACVGFLAHTFFTDGGMASSINGSNGGFRKKRTGPEYRTRVFVDADAPIDFARLHAVFAEEFANETGQTPLRQEGVDAYLRRHNALHDQERQLFMDDPYTWGDHLRWYLQAPRREFLG